MTSLPLYWPLDAEFGDLAQGNGAKPWQRDLIEQEFELVLLDTLSPIPTISPDGAETDPLVGLDRLAIVQPRGLSPADNLALDDWVREGGHLLLVLDPMLTGEYEYPLGDPRRPIDSALIPPLVKRWGMEITFDETQDFKLQEAPLGIGHIWYALPGKITREQTPLSSCQLSVYDTVARCFIGKGRVTIVADAASFEHAPNEVEDSYARRAPLLNVLDFAFYVDLADDIPAPNAKLP